MINKESNDITFDLNKLSVMLNKFQDTKITHNYGGIYSGSIESVFDKKLESKVWFNSAQGKDKYVQVDLGGVVDIDKIDLVIGDSEKDYFRNGNLEISLDGEKWEVIDEITGESREANFPTLKAPYRYRTTEGINKRARYIRLISKNNSNAWLALNEILINDGINIDTNTSLSLIAKPEGELSNTSESVIDKKLSTFYTPAGEALGGELLYRLSDYSEVGELIILQGPTGISNASVQIRDLDGWHEIGTLSNSYNYFDTSNLNNVLDVKLVWNGIKPIINEIITVKKSSENTPNDIINKDELKSIIEKAKNIVENESDKYIEETIESLKEAITIAEKVLDNDKATQDEVNEAYNTLIREYLNLRLIPDKSLLEELIKELEALDLSKYTEKSANFVKKELANASKVLSNKEATKTEVDEAVENLRRAKESLVEKDNSSNSNETESNENLPKTGDVISSSVILIIAGVLIFGGVLIFKKKKILK